MGAANKAANDGGLSELEEAVGLFGAETAAEEAQVRQNLNALPVRYYSRNQ